MQKRSKGSVPTSFVFDLIVSLSSYHNCTNGKKTHIYLYTFQYICFFVEFKQLLKQPEEEAHYFKNTPAVSALSPVE